MNVPSLVCPSTLTVHPLAASMPQWSDDDPRFISLQRGILERGIDQPILADPAGRIADGRHRWRAARRLCLKTVPVRLCPEDEIAGIVLGSLLQRRHYTCSALAYLAYPLLKPAHEEARARSLAALKIGKKPNVSPSSPPGTTGTKRVEDLALGLGIGRTLFAEAAKVHKLFGAEMEYKAEMEPRILEGEVGLGGVIAGWAGRLATKGKSRPNPEQLELWGRTWSDLGHRYAIWSRLDAEAKVAALQPVVHAVGAMPDDLLTELKRRITAETRRRLHAR